MPSWEKFGSKAVTPVKGVKIQSPIPLAGQARVSLQAFCLAILQHELSSKRKQNVLLSPVSVFVSLALRAYVTDAEFNQTTEERLHSLHQQGEAELEIAKALWVDARATNASDF